MTTSLNLNDIQGNIVRAYGRFSFPFARYFFLHISDPEAGRKFVDAVEAGAQFLVNHPKESWKLFVSGKRKELDDELNRLAWRDTLPRFALRPGALDKNRYRQFAEFLKSKYEELNLSAEINEFDGGHDYKKWNEKKDCPKRLDNNFSAAGPVEQDNPIPYGIMVYHVIY